VRGLLIRREEDSGPEELEVEGVFVEVGLIPNSDPFRGAVELNERGEVEVDCRGGTSEPGIFAAGDVTTVPYKQIIVAAGEGAKAALSAHDYLLRRKS
jgi:alkyl hydroperoxide reductase subunit F